MTESGDDAEAQDDQILVGLLADPGSPADLADQLAPELPKLLSRRVNDRVSWTVRISPVPLTAGLHSTSEMLDAVRERKEQEGYDVAICLTDLPLRTDGRPMAAHVNTVDRVGLISLPALAGIWQQRRRTREAIVQIVGDLLEPGEGEGEGEGAARPRRRLNRLIAGRVVPVRRVTPVEEAADARFVTPAGRGRLRLVAGMVRANRPWRLVPYLSKALAAALATSALASVNGIVWQLADALGAVRLSVATVSSVATMVIWLIVYRRLWERPTGPSPWEREKAALYNTATVLTLTAGVLFCYAALFVGSLVAVLFIIDSGVFERTLRHPVDAGSYVALAWMASSMATVGGALGSGFESDEAVRHAAYGKREEQRRAEREQAARR
ncbi:MAG: putative rane protein [Actinomycetia bacterium]|nr:putative rane protein [Actinomycetes bacterium]